MRAAILALLLTLGGPVWGQATNVTVTLRTDPPGAAIYNGLDACGVSGQPVTLKVTPSMQLTLKREGYRDATVSDSMFAMKVNQPDNSGHLYPPPNQPAISLEATSLFVAVSAFAGAHPVLDGLLLALLLGFSQAGLRGWRWWQRQRTLGSMVTETADFEGSLVMQVLGGYRLIEILGKGGMGVVYRAVRDDSLDMSDTYACKVIGRTYFEDAEYRGRFEREIKVFSELSHPNIVRLYAFGEQDERIFLIMEEVQGKTLTDHIPAGGAPLQWTLGILEQLAEAIDYAHGRGIVHRDLKPDNVMLTHKGQVKVMDFGLAYRLDSASKLTQTGTAMGTPAYMAPEQIMGRPATDPRLDQYAVGVIAFRMLTGRLPFEADNMVALLNLQLSSPPPALHGICPDLPAAVNAPIQKMMAKDVKQRYPNTRAAIQALREAVGDRERTPVEPAPARPASESTTGPMPALEDATMITHREPAPLEEATIITQASP